MVEFEVPYDEALDPAQVDEGARAPRRDEFVALGDRSPVGCRNPLAEIGPIAERADALVVADVVSSLGAAEVRHRRLSTS